MYKKILVPIDGSSTSLRGLEEAIKLAKGGRTGLVLLNVVDESQVMYPSSGYAAYIGELIESLRESGRKILAAAEKRVRARGIKAKPMLGETVGGPVADVIIAQAKKQRVDLIVLGTHGRRGVRRLVMGSDAEGVVRRSSVPVLLVRSAGGARRRGGTR